MTTPTQHDLATLRRLLSEATPGTWSASSGDRCVTTDHQAFSVVREVHPEDARLIAAMKNALPALLEAAERGQKVISYIKKAWPESPGSPSYGQRDRELREIYALLTEPSPIWFGGNFTSDPDCKDCWIQDGCWHNCGKCGSVIQAREEAKRQYAERERGSHG